MADAPERNKPALAKRNWMRPIVQSLPSGWLVVAERAHDDAPVIWTHPKLLRRDIERCARAGVIAVAKRPVDENRIEIVIRRAI